MPSNLKLGYKTRCPRKTTEIENTFRAVAGVKALWFICSSAVGVKKSGILQKKGTSIFVLPRRITRGNRPCTDKLSEANHRVTINLQPLPRTP